MDNEQMLTEVQRLLEGMEQRFEAKMAEGFARIEKRLDLQGGLIQSGSRAIARFAEWSEGTDGEVFRMSEKFAALEKRVAALEHPQQQ